MFRYSTNSFVAWGLAALGNAAESLKCWSDAREAAKPLGGRLLLGEWFAAIEAEIEKLDVEIDERVYELYGLTPDEIKIIGGATTF